MARSDAQSDAESEIAVFVARYAPEIQQQIRACRAALRRRIRRGHELVYDNYNALVFGYGPSNKASEAVLSIAAYPRWVTLFFLRGAVLDDPDRLLEGSGKQVRGIRLRGADDFDRPGVARLIDQALGAMDALPTAAGLPRTEIRSVSARQRPRRAARP